MPLSCAARTRTPASGAWTFPEPGNAPASPPSIPPRTWGITGSPDRCWSTRRPSRASSSIARTQVPLAKDKVRFMGEPVVMVLAESRYIAEDALDEVVVDYEPLDAVVDLEQL